MHSGTLERAGSPRKRTLSRGVSEDESLRNIIKETENATRRLTRSDSRGTLKRRSESQQLEQDLIMGLPEMVELQASYDEAVQEMRGLELGREVLLFQVDVLQEALEGAEEMLAEAQREAGQASRELEREREAKRKLEDMVSSLLQELERLKEERNTVPAVPVYTLVRDQEKEHELARQKASEENDDMKKGAVEHVENAPSKEAGSSQGAPPSVDRLESIPLDTPRNASSSEASGGGLLSFFRKPSDGSSHPPPLGVARLGSSVDSDDVGEGVMDGGGPLTKLQRMVNKTFGQMPSLALGSSPPQDGVLRSPGGSQPEDGRDPSPDRNKDTDSISAYEDACADTPELENVFPGPSDDAGSEEEEEEKEEDPTNISQTTGQEPRSPNDSCILS